MDWDPSATDAGGYICPPCPVFHPTLDEFRDPLKYISSIRHVGMRAGICKIVPPAGWRPPFAINERAFRFRTRVQQLNCIDAHSRAEGHFVEALRMFLYRRGTPMRALPRVDGQLVNLRLLFQAVTELGGYRQVCESQQWATVVRRVGRTRAAGHPSDQLCRTYQQHYEELLHAYEDEQEGKNMSQDQKQGQESGDVKMEQVSGVDSGENHDAQAGKSSAHVMETPTPKPAAANSTVDTNNGSNAGSAGQPFAAATPMPKSRSSMKKTRRRSSTADEEQTAPGEGDNHSSDSVRVKRTLFADAGSANSGSDDNGAVASTKSRGDKQNSSSSPTKRAKRDATASAISAAQSVTLEPASLKPSPKRTYRLDPPEIVVGQRFFRFFPEIGAIVAEVKRVLGGKKPHAVIRYLDDGATDDVEIPTLQILIANGWNPAAAELAYKSEICQACLRGDCSEKMLLCDGCDGGHHLFCLNPPLREVPEGDWYCEACVAQAANEATDDKAARERMTFGFEMGAETSLMTYKAKADAWKREYFGVPHPSGQHDSTTAIPELTDLKLEKEYWRILGTPAHEQRLEVEYGSDVDSGAVGSGFPRMDTYLKCMRFIEQRWKKTAASSPHGKGKNKDGDPLFTHGLRAPLESGMPLEDLLSQYARDGWNLNNLPKLPGSVLQHLDEDIKGVMVPWIYMGMCFSTFCWHVEDHNFYSISYLHCGDPKTWYGVPCDQADKFEATMRKLTPELFGKQPDLHLQMVTMFSPATLREHGVPVYRATQRANEFIVTFPSAYHGGFNNGFNCAEAVNFSTIDWLPWGSKSVSNYRRYRKLPVFCHEALVCSLSETLADGDTDGSSSTTRNETFDADAAKRFLVPAMQQLRDEFAQFEARVAASPVTRRGLMREYEQYLHSGNGLTTANSANGTGLASTTRRSMASRMNARMGANDPCEQEGEHAESGDEHGDEHGDEYADSTASRGMKRRKLSTKMRMASSPPPTPAGMNVRRPSRMVLWAGQSGRHEGLRCASCKQYCFLQAVACTRCALRQPTEAHRTVACAEHVAGMCKCDPEKYYMYLYRYTLSDLDALLDRMRAKLRRVDEWVATVNAIFGSEVKEDVKMMGIDEVKAEARTGKPTAGVLETLLSTGRELGGVPSARLDTLQRVIDAASAWSERANAVLNASPDQPANQQQHHGYAQRPRAPTPQPVSWDEICSLLTDAKQLVAVPTGLDRVQQLESSWSESEAIVQQMLARVASIQHSEAVDVSTFSLSSRNDVNDARRIVVALDAENETLRDVMDELADVRTRVSCIALDVAKAAAAELDRAISYLEVLCGANAMVAAAACRLAAASSSTNANNFVRVGEAECRALVEEADGLRLDRSVAIRKIELLRSLLRASQHGAEELAAALSGDRVSSAEELAALLERAQKLPILPARADEIAARLQQCRAWDARATELLHNGNGGNTAANVAASASKPSLAEVEAFCNTADAHFVPASSLLRRQLHSRVQDAKRWQQSVVSLFLRPSGSRMALDTFFSRALSRLHDSGANKDVNGGIFQRWRVHCVCEQVLNDKAPVITCRRCSRYFHPACVGLSPDAPSSRHHQSFTCPGCRQGASKSSLPPYIAPPDVFCSCRGPEMLPMVCCDFCDEWYHGACVGMSGEDMSRVEAYRCPRCAVRQRVAYLDATLTSPATTPSLCEGRRPALARVRALLTQLSTQLVAEPAGARALVKYVEAVEGVVSEARAYAKQFTQQFSPASFAQMDAPTEQRRVAATLEQLAALEIAPGTGRCDEDAEEERGSGGETEDDDVVASLRAIHWCLRACTLVLGCDHAPKYSHLVVLLDDARRIQQRHRQRPHQSTGSPSASTSGSSSLELPLALMPPFVPSEYARIQHTITDLVARAERWLRQVKMLEVEEWNVGKARRLRGEYEELVQFLELPAAEVKLVHDIASGNGSSSNSFTGDAVPVGAAVNDGAVMYAL